MDEDRSLDEVQPRAPRTLTRRKKVLFGAAGLAVLAGSLLCVPAVRFELGLGWMEARGLFGGSTVDLEPARARLRGARGKGTPLPLPNSRVVVHKQERRLDLFDGDKLVKSYRVALGPKPSEPKAGKGDGRTPTGDYFICSRNGRTKFHLFMGLNYPSAADARAALSRGGIAPAESRAIEDAEARRVQPPWDTTLGGAIGVHGGGTGRDWTLGCVALSNEDVEEVWAATVQGTPVKIEE